MSETNEPSPSDEERPRWRHVLDLIGVLEVTIVLPLALLARWLPSTRGGTLDIAPLVVEAPTYIEGVLVNAVMLNVLLLAVGLLLFGGAKGIKAWCARA